MQVPKPSGGNVRPGSLPGVRVGNAADASHFGANNYRDLGNLGRAVQKAGHSLIDEAQDRQKEEDDTFARNAIIETRKAIEDQEQILRNQYQGQDSVKFPEEMGKLARQVRERIGGGLQNDHQRKTYAWAMDAYDGQLQEKAFSYRDQQMEAAKNNSLMALNEMVVEKAAAGEENEDVALAILYSNTDTLTKGQSNEVKDLAKRQAARILFTRRAETLAANSPEAAVKYLDSDRVREAFPAAELKKLREGYCKAAIEAEQKSQVDAGIGEVVGIVRNGGDPGEVYLQLVREVGKETADKVMAGYDKYAGYVKNSAEQAEKADTERLSSMAAARGRELGKMGEDEMSMSAIRDEAYANWGEKYGKMLFDAADGERKAMQADRGAAAVQKELDLDKELKDAGGNATKMKSFGAFTTDEQNKWLEKARKNREGQTEQVRLSRYLELNELSDDDLLDLWDSPTRDEIMEQLGGVNGKYFKLIKSRVDPYTKQGGGKTDSKKFLDNELNTINRELRQALRHTGRVLGKEDEDAVADSILQYMDRRYDEEMEKVEADGPDKLPRNLRRQIQAGALLSYRVDGQTITRAEAWERGVDVSKASVAPEGLSPELRRNYLGGNVKKTPGGAFIETDIPTSLVPEGVRDTANAAKGVIFRALGSGGYTVIGRTDGYKLDANGENPQKFTAEQLEAVQAGLMRYSRGYADPDFGDVLSVDFPFLTF